MIHEYKNIISIENLLCAWKEFLKGKRSKKDVLEFGSNLMENILNLHTDLQNKTYVHGTYKAFNISDPKPRNIHKASVSDRLLHHAIYRILYPYFDRKFVSDSFSCRVGKGTHKAMNRFRHFARKVSKNNTRTCSVSKCDIKKFFASIDQNILLGILKKNIEDEDVIWLLERIIGSFNSGISGRGLPLGNLTSQLFVNIYMNEFDQWMKHKMRVKYYIRYADDFVVLSDDKDYLVEIIPKIANFLKERLKLLLHPDKVFMKTLASGVDFLGWVHFPDHRALRTSTRRRLLKNIKESNKSSYLGLLKHGNSYALYQRIKSLKGDSILLD